jgi:DNA-binding CsgD family transcriptional regulator
MPGPRSFEETLLEIRRLARLAQRRATRPPEMAPLIARLLANCQTVAIEKRPAGYAFILQFTNEKVDCRLTCLMHGDEVLPLTASERAVAQQLCDGRTLAQIARLRGVSVNTVKSQVRQIFRKLDVETRVGVVRRLCP